ncbi:MAG: OmpA family protein [Myxococcota bacterium]
MKRKRLSAHLNSSRVGSSRGLRLVLAVVGSVLVLGCGYSEDEWQAQLAKYNQLAQAHQATQGNLQQTQARLKQVEGQLKLSQQRVSQLEQDLQEAGFDLNKLNESLAQQGEARANLEKRLEDRMRALKEYQARAEQLERIKKRFELLRSKLNELTNLGLAVSVRNNRMVISLPGDVLFESGQDGLKKDGKEVLKKVAGIIGSDPGLKARVYQVAGHTDNVELLGGRFKDNWGLSLMRARTVLLYLIDPAYGALPRKNWSAAGFADTDPVAANDTKENKQKNRRCELVVVPSAEEMLDLKNITG